MILNNNYVDVNNIITIIIIITVLRHTATDASIVIHQHGHSYRNNDPNNTNIVNTANIAKNTATTAARQK